MLVGSLSTCLWWGKVLCIFHLQAPGFSRGVVESSQATQGLARRSGVKKAKVALARKIAVIMHRMLADQIARRTRVFRRF